jgi:hypothetical protein
LRRANSLPWTSKLLRVLTLILCLSTLAVMSSADTDTYTINYIIPVTANPAPIIASWSNDNTSDDSLVLNVDTGTTIIFNVTADQIISMWSWTSATQINGSGSTDSYAFKTFSNAGIQTVQVYGTNANGSTQEITWMVNVGAIIPELNENDVFISDYNMVKRINNGTVVYKIINLNPVTTAITIDNSSIFYACKNVLYSADKRNGTILYKIVLKRDVTTPILFDNSSIYYGSNNIMYTSDKFNGTILFQNRFGKEIDIYNLNTLYVRR